MHVIQRNRTSLLSQWLWVWVWMGLKCSFWVFVLAILFGGIKKLPLSEKCCWVHITIVHTPNQFLSISIGKKKKNLKGKSINGLFLYMWKNLLEGQFSLVDWWKNSSANYAALLNLKEYSEHWKPFSCLCGKTGKGSEAMSIRGAPRQLCASWDTGSGCAQRKLWAQAYGLLGKTHREVRGGKVEFPLRVLSTFLYLLSQ